jgi:hypothetical protein
MRRLRLMAAGLAVTALLTVTTAPALAARPPDPSVTRLVATALWVTDSDQDKHYYVLWMDLYAQGTRSGQHTECVTVTYPDGTQVAESWYAFPRSQRGSEVMLWLQFGEIPEGVTSLRVTAQVMRIGARNCCTPVGTQRAVEAQLPVRPAPPPAPSVPQVVFDVTFTTP